jgi:hypothetical protein
MLYRLVIQPCNGGVRMADQPNIVVRQNGPKR